MAVELTLLYKIIIQSIYIRIRHNYHRHILLFHDYD